MVTRKAENDHLKKLIEELERKQIKVGFFEDAKYADGTQVAYIAAIQELGYAQGGIPPRPFMRPSMEAGRSNYTNGMAAAFRRAASGQQSLQDGLVQVGGVAAGDVQEGIRNVTQPALKDSTIAARASRHSKGMASSKPLVDTGKLLESVTFVVEDK